MSEAKNINSFPSSNTVWKGDELLITDPTGDGKKTAIENIAGSRRAFTCTSSQWVRFASFQGSADCLISLTTYWYNTAGQRTLVELLLHANSLLYNKCTVLSSIANYGIPGVITKMRVVIKPGDACYLDFYYAPNANNSGVVRLINGDRLTFLKELEYDAEIPEGYSSTEFALTNTSWGGVNCYFTTIYNLPLQLLQKGGVQHERSDAIDKRCTQTDSCRHDALPRCGNRLGRSVRDRRLQYDLYFYMPKSANGFYGYTLAVQYSGGIRQARNGRPTTVVGSEAECSCATNRENHSAPFVERLGEAYSLRYGRKEVVGL